MTHLNLLKKAILLSGVAMISFAATAKAGFEWKGPLEAPHTAVEAPAASAPSPDAELAPVTSWSNDPALAPPATAPVESAPVMAAASAAAPVGATPSAEGDVLTGFGSGLPLVIALQQIVPPGYQYSFSAGTNPGVSVSWEGGKPWQQVLADTLAPQGLGYHLQGNAVVIGSFSNDGAQVAPTPAPEAPAAAPQDGMMSPAPDDSAPVAITSAPPAAPAQTEMSAAPAAVPVTIHREKPSSLLERLGWKRDNTDVPSETASSPAPEKTASAAAPAAAPVSDAAPAPVATPGAAGSSWAGLKGQTLRDVLKSWSDKAGVELYWSIDYDYRLSDDISTGGTYDEAVGGLLDKFAAVRPQPYGQLHQSASGPRVLVVKSYDLTR